MFSPSATGHRGIIIGDLRTHLHHLTYSRCSHWCVACDTRCARLPDNRTFSVDLRGTGHLPITIADFVLRHAQTGIIHGSSASAVGNLVICRPAAQHRILHFPSSWQAGIYSPITDHSATGTITRELSIDRDLTHTGLFALHSTTCHLHASHRPHPLSHRKSISYLFNHKQSHVRKHARQSGSEGIRNHRRCFQRMPRIINHQSTWTKHT